MSVASEPDTIRDAASGPPTEITPPPTEVGGIGSVASASTPPTPDVVSSIAPDARRGGALGHVPGVESGRGLRALLAPLRSKPVRALAWFALIAAIPYLHPKLTKLRLVKAPWDHSEDVIADGGPTGIVAQYGDDMSESANDELPPTDEQHAPIEVQVQPAASATDPKIPLIDVAKDVGASHRPIEDPSGHALDAFYAALAKTESGVPGSAVRVAHYGDSLIVSDFMSSTLRRRFQARFGDAGHGFILIAKAWKWYLHNDVSHSSSEGWLTNRIVNPRIADELYGYGGVSFRSSDMGVKASFGTSKPPPAGMPDEGFGRRVSRFQVHYLEQPKGGKFDLTIDGKKISTIDTLTPGGGTDKALKTATVTVDDGEHSLEVKVAGGAEARLFGVALEREVPGVVWDALGVLGGRARMLDVNDDAHWAASLRARDPALVVLQYGTNESTDTGYPMDQYEASLEAVLRQVRAALPQASCLVVGPMDRAGKGGAETMPIILKLEESQRKVAIKVGCAFWDTFLAMGGPGAMGRWVKAKPQLGSGDYTHPTYAGASILGDLLYSALMEGYMSAPKPLTKPAP
jgi:lysophospholipase L1-like esterase